MVASLRESSNHLFDSYPENVSSIYFYLFSAIDYGCFIEGDSERSNFLFTLIPKTSIPFIFTYLVLGRLLEQCLELLHL